ncbi:MAG TPA: hypothetical protein VJU84_12645 [Pyrinomonadaceae bacterium]|nr:hypothetical protein [Pyrinomonadaceae bacterium]
MGWEQRGTYQYYYRKERDGSRVKSVYVGRGEIAQMISEIQASSSVIEKFAKSRNEDDNRTEMAELVFEQTTQLLTQATLLAAGFHTHHRQWRRKRSVGNCWGSPICFSRGAKGLSWFTVAFGINMQTVNARLAAFLRPTRAIGFLKCNGTSQEIGRT